jgi:hypothetical protein
MGCFHSRVLVGALAALLTLLGAQHASATSPFPVTGTCGMLGSYQMPFAYQFGQNAGPNWALNILGSLDFRTNTYTGNYILIDPAAQYTTQHQSTVSGSFTIADGPITDSHVLHATFTVNGNVRTVAWNAIAVNHGNTLLLQQTERPTGTEGFAGVCQF